MAIIYALQGVGNKGKSTTLLTMCNRLESGNGKPLTAIEYTSRNKVKDKSIILTDIRERTSNTLKKVGITSHGDIADRIKRAIDEFLSNNCDIIFCACHLSGNTVDCVNSYTQHNINFIPQVIDNNTATQSQTNMNTADNLIMQAGL